MGFLKRRARKSGFEDSFFFIVLLLGIVIFILVLSFTWGRIKQPLNEGLSSSMPSDSSINISTTLNQVEGSTALFDKLIPFLIIGLFAFVLIGTAAYINHPIMLFVGIIILGVCITLAVIYANVYHQISQADEFASTTASLGIGDLFMQYLPYIIVILFIGILIAVLFAKGGGSLNQL